MRKTINHDNNNKLDLYRFGYLMMLIAFKDEDIKIGVRNALFLTKMFTQSSDVLLYKKNSKTGEYELYINALMIKHNRKNNVGWLKTYINDNKYLFEGRGVIDIGCKDISDDKEITIVPLVTESGRKYALVIRNCNIYDAYKNQVFIELLEKNMITILKQLESYRKFKHESEKDELTGLDNRIEYAKVIKYLETSNERFTYVLFDLLGLKTINDEYGYMMGDAYIIKATEILKRYFSKYYIVRDTAGVVDKVHTGSCLYRTGGDEFILISKNEPENVIMNKLKNIEEEVADIELNTGNKVYLGINYGVAVRNENESIKGIAALADERMKIHKAEMYERLKDKGVTKRIQFK